MKFQVPPFVQRIGAWIRAKWPPFWQKFKEEFYDKIVGILVGAIIAGIFLFLGFDRLEAWRDDVKKKRQSPARVVYYQGEVSERYDPSKKVAGVSIKLEDVLGEVAVTDSLGRYFFSREEAYGDRYHIFILTKEGYKTMRYPQLMAPAVEGDTLKENFKIERRPSSSISPASNITE